MKSSRNNPIMRSIFEEARQHVDIAMFYAELGLVSPSNMLKKLIVDSLTKEQFADVMLHVLTRFNLSRDEKVSELLEKFNAEVSELI